MDIESGDSSDESYPLSNSLQEINWSCRFCDQTFSSQSTLIRHERTHTGETPHQNKLYKLSLLEDAVFSCKVCSKSFDSEVALTKHWNAHPDEQLFKCSHCDMRFSQSCQLRKHNNTHSIPESHRCEYCNKCFTSGPNLSRHKIVHPEYRRSIGAKPARCRRCNKRFSRQDYLKRHLRLHCIDKPFQCKICPKSFTSETNLSEHQMKHSENFDKTDQPKDIRCEVCAKTFTRWRSLDMHVRLRHSGARVHKCEHCDKSFAYSYNLSRHKKQHFVEKKKSFPCEECHRSYSRRDSLMNHRKIHLGLMKYRCDRCSVLFEREEQLNRHKQKHVNEPSRRQKLTAKHVVLEVESDSDDGKSHQCKHCPMSFKRKMDLQRHDKAHSIHNVKISIRPESDDDKPLEYFHPNDDEYDYTLNTELAEVGHDLNLPDTEHLGILKYRCDRCSMLFKCKDELDLHKQKHTYEFPQRQTPLVLRVVPEVGESERNDGKSYRCRDCPMSFRHKVDLERHRVAHNIPRVKIFIGSTETSEETNDKPLEYLQPPDKDYDHTLNTEPSEVEHDLNLLHIEQPFKQTNSSLQTKSVRCSSVSSSQRDPIQVKMEPVVHFKEIKKEPVDDYEEIDTSPIIIDVKPAPIVYGASSGTVREQSNRKAFPQKRRVNVGLNQAKKSSNSSVAHLTRISMKAPRSYVSFRHGRRYAQFSIFKTSKS